MSIRSQRARAGRFARPEMDATPHPFPRMLCAVDGTTGAQEAVEQVLSLADERSEITFLAVAHGFADGDARAALEAAQAAGTARGLPSETILRHAEDRAHAILAQADGFDLLALGAHKARREGGIAIHGTSTAALHRSPVPLLLARPAPGGSAFPEHIVLASDASEAMRRRGRRT
jgi:nucleotide-binding universal stress UspA family protein